MKLRSQTKVSGSSAKPRATSQGRGIAADRETNDYDANVTSLVGLPSSPITTTRDGKLASHTHPVQGGRTRTSIPSARSESAGGAVGSPEGSPPRRQGESREYGDVGEMVMRDSWSPVAAAKAGDHRPVETKVQIVHMIHISPKSVPAGRIYPKSRLNVS